MINQKYLIAYGDTYEDLEKVVNQQIELGYAPIGSITVENRINSYYNSDKLRWEEHSLPNVYIQALLKS